MPSIHRVVVRGQFADLTDAQRAALLAEVADHEVFKAAYTAAGTFTYEPPLIWFQFRYEIRLADDDDADPEPEPDAAEVGMARALAQLDEWGIGHKHLRATATDMAQVWSG